MNPILIDIPMPIKTPRLLLRPPQAGDGAEMNAAIKDSFEELKIWMPWARELPSVESSEERARRAHAEFILREDMQILIFDKATGKIAGSTGLHRIKWEIPAFEIGYWCRTSFVGKGYISESTNALTRFAFDQLKAKRVEIRCNSKNQRSLAVMKRLGFDYEGCLRSSDIHADKSVSERDTVIYARLNLESLPPLDVTW